MADSDTNLPRASGCRGDSWSKSLSGRYGDRFDPEIAPESLRNAVGKSKIPFWNSFLPAWWLSITAGEPRRGSSPS